jgi:hypothetical protein
MRCFILTQNDIITRGFTENRGGLTKACSTLLIAGMGTPNGVECHVLHRTQMTGPQIMEALIEGYAMEVRAKDVHYVLTEVELEG